MASGKGRNPQGFRGRLIGKITPRGKEGGVWEGSEDNMNKNINVPNALSVLRLLVIAPFVYFYLNDQIVPAVTMLVISGLSDMFDGMIARRFNQITPLGQMLDPLADKLTQGAVAICMAIRYPILIPVLIIFVVKEFSMIVAACVLLKKKKNPGPSKWYGKAATVMFYITFILIVAQEILQTQNNTLVIVLLVLTAVMMLYALLRYFLVFLRVLRSDDPKDRINLELKAKREKKE